MDARVLSQMASYNNTPNSNSNQATTNNKRSTESPVQQKKDSVETQQQRQAAAKLALRKQLEKTLLQVMYQYLNPGKNIQRKGLAQHSFLSRIFEEYNVPVGYAFRVNNTNLASLNTIYFLYLLRENFGYGVWEFSFT